MGWDGTERNRMGWDGMGWDGMGRMGWDRMVRHERKGEGRAGANMR